MLRKNTNNSNRITIPFFSFGRRSFCFRSISFHPKHLDVRRAHYTDEENTNGAFTVSCTQNHIHQFKLLVAFAQLHSGVVTALFSRTSLAFLGQSWSFYFLPTNQSRYLRLAVSKSAVYVVFLRQWQ